MRRLSVIIKAYNEEENIARAITSSLQAVAPYQGEVILADGASTDRTVEIASRCPITIVVLRHPERRCCGVGPQLGFPHTDGEYVYMLDGDMELDASFVAKAIAYLDENPDVAGVGGAVLETRAPNSEFRSRINRLNRLSDKVADMFCLNGGGLYRRAALMDVGYMSDQNLHGSEEYDLGARLRGKGWRIVRLPDHAADHFAHQLKTLPLLWRRVRNGQLLSLGEVVRALRRHRWVGLPPGKGGRIAGVVPPGASAEKTCDRHADEHERAPAEQYGIRVNRPHTPEREP